jgi:nucleotide-binding universal stress UspA family protein
MYRKILVGFDNSEGSRAALEQAIHLAKSLGSEVHALWVKGSLPHYPETISELKEEGEAANLFQQQVDSYVEQLSKESGLAIQNEARVGNPAKIILAVAEEGQFDLIVVGESGHSRLWGGTLGHVADKISEHAKCSVLIVRQS